ncbi:hypothetical protein NKH18_44720 [Streptomyces sp. M10(2022)]
MSGKTRSFTHSGVALASGAALLVGTWAAFPAGAATTPEPRRVTAAAQAEHRSATRHSTAGPPAGPAATPSRRTC